VRRLIGAAPLIAALALFAPAAALGAKKRVAHNRHPTAKVVVAVRKTKLGPVLVDSAGRTLYVFLRDRGGKSFCYGACAEVWPPALVGSRRLVFGKGVDGKKVGKVRRKDGKLQLIYNHHPLYTYVGDTAPGQTNGEGISSFGGRWFVISPAGLLVKHSGR